MPRGAHSCGVSATRTAYRQGRPRRRRETCPRRERLLRRVWTCKSTVRAGHARPLLQKRCVTLASSSISCPGAHRAPALLPFGFPRATHAASCPTDATAAPNDPDSVL